MNRSNAGDYRWLSPSEFDLFSAKVDADSCGLQWISFAVSSNDVMSAIAAPPDWERLPSVHSSKPLPTYYYQSAGSLFALELYSDASISDVAPGDELLMTTLRDRSRPEWEILKKLASLPRAIYGKPLISLFSGPPNAVHTGAVLERHASEDPLDWNSVYRCDTLAEAETLHRHLLSERFEGDYRVRRLQSGEV